MKHKKLLYWVAGAVLLVAGFGLWHARQQQRQTGWHITVYYTAVESYHHQPVQKVYGCSLRDCEHGNAFLGAYPGDFVDAVKQEGTGRITSGKYAGKYLNWSYDAGYWLDDIPADTHGNALEPYVSAAADKSVLPQSTRVVIANCGTTDVDAKVCAKLKRATFIIRDEFTPGLGGKKHLDVYIGEENQDNFEDSPAYTDLQNATIKL